MCVCVLEFFRCGSCTSCLVDRDAEVYIKTDIPNKQKIQQDILVKRGDGKGANGVRCAIRMETSSVTNVDG